MAIQRQAAPTPNTLLYNKQSGQQYLMGQTVPGLFKEQFVSTMDAQKSGLVAAPPVYKNAMEAKIAAQKSAVNPLAAVPPGVNPKLYLQQQAAKTAAANTAALAKKGLTATRGGYTLAATDPASLGLGTGWAPKIGHITTKAATAVTKRAVNPLLSPAAATAGRRRNPFQVEQTPSADLFGLNIPT